MDHLFGKRVSAGGHISSVYLRRAGNARNPLAKRGIRDELGKTPLACLLALRAHHPVRGEPAIAGRLLLEESPGLLPGAKPLLACGIENDVAVLERVDGGTCGIACRERLHAGRRHAARLLQGFPRPDVDRAPDALRPARSEALHVGAFVVAPDEPVDPPEAQRFVHGLLVGEAALGRMDLPEADPKLWRARMVLFQPTTELGGGCEEGRLHRGL